MKLTEFNNLDEAPLFGYLGQALGKKLAGTGMSSTQNQMALDIFIDDFVDDAMGAIQTGVQSGLINADPNSAFGSQERKQEPQQQPQQPQQQKQQQPQNKSTVPQGGGKVSGQISQTPNAIRKREQRAANQAPVKNLGLGDVVRQLTPQTVKSTGGTTTQTPRGNVHTAAPTNPNQKFATAPQGGTAPATKDNPKFLPPKGKVKQPATVKESKFTKLNQIFESVVSLYEKGPTPAASASPTKIAGGFGTGPFNKPYSPLKLPQQPSQPQQQTQQTQQTPQPGQEQQTGQMGIAQYLKSKWFPFYMRGVQVDSGSQQVVDKIFKDVQTSYGADKGKQALTKLAQASYSMAKANIDSGMVPDGAKDIAGQLNKQSAGNSTAASAAPTSRTLPQLQKELQSLKMKDPQGFQYLLSQIK